MPHSRIPKILVFVVLLWGVSAFAKSYPKWCDYELSDTQRSSLANVKSVKAAGFETLLAADHIRTGIDAQQIHYENLIPGQSFLFSRKVTGQKDIQLQEAYLPELQKILFDYVHGKVNRVKDKPLVAKVSNYLKVCGVHHRLTAGLFGFPVIEIIPTADGGYLNNLAFLLQHTGFSIQIDLSIYREGEAVTASKLRSGKKGNSVEGVLRLPLESVIDPEHPSPILAHELIHIKNLRRFVVDDPNHLTGRLEHLLSGGPLSPIRPPPVTLFSKGVEVFRSPNRWAYSVDELEALSTQIQAYVEGGLNPPQFLIHHALIISQQLLVLSELAISNPGAVPRSVHFEKSGVRYGALAFQYGGEFGLLLLKFWISSREAPEKFVIENIEARLRQLKQVAGNTKIGLMNLLERHYRGSVDGLEFR